MRGIEPLAVTGQLGPLLYPLSYTIQLREKVPLYMHGVESERLMVRSTSEGLRGLPASVSLSRGRRNDVVLIHTVIYTVLLWKSTLFRNRYKSFGFPSVSAILEPNQHIAVGVEQGVEHRHGVIPHAGRLALHHHRFRLVFHHTVI